MRHHVLAARFCAPRWFGRSDDRSTAVVRAVVCVAGKVESGGVGSGGEVPLGVRVFPGQRVSLSAVLHGGLRGEGMLAVPGAGDGAGSQELLHREPGQELLVQIQQAVTQRDE